MGSGRRLLVLEHFCGAPRLLCKIRKFKDYNFTNDYMNLERKITRMREARVKPMRDHEKFGSYYYIDLERIS